MNNGEHVKRFEDAFASYVDARFAIALNSGTSTLHTALEAWADRLGESNQRPTEIQVPPLTMASTTIAVLHAGLDPVFTDVDPDTWIMCGDRSERQMPVALYGLNLPYRGVIDAAQTLQPHPPMAAFTSYSFQASKILALGEGGMLVTNDEDLARRAREFSSLGYHMDPDQPRIDPAVLKHPTYARHRSLGWNYRMSDLVAAKGKFYFSGTFPDDPSLHTAYPHADDLLTNRRKAAHEYRDAIAGCPWITPQHVPEGWTHDYWAFAVALESAELWEPFTDAIVRHGGEMPFGAWRITYQEPAFRHLAEDGCCPVAEDLQPRLCQFQTDNLTSARRNADAVAKAIQEVGG